METKVKTARIVPTSSSGNNLLANVFGEHGTGTGRKSDAWSERECVPHKLSKAQEEDPAEPFIAKESESESSVESERLFKKPKTRIYSIDLERNVPKDKRDRKIRGSVLSASECSSSGSANECKQDSQFDAKLVDKFVKTNRKRRKRKDTKTALVKLCQCCPWTVPWSLLVISAIQICTYIFNKDTFYQLLIFSPVLQHEIWRFVTYTFLHANAVHLMLNVIIQIIVAFPLETEQGHGSVLAVYFAGVIAGGMGASVFEPTQMVGASAGVYCLLISHVPHIVMNFQSLSHRYFRIMAVLVLCVSDVIYSIRHCMTKGNLQPRIGVPAHVSGAICGLLIGFIVYQGEKLMHFRIARYGAMVLLSGWIVATIMYNMQVKA